VITKLLFAQIKIGDEFLFEAKKFRKTDNATALDIAEGIPRFFDQFDAIQLL